MLSPQDMINRESRPVSAGPPPNATRLPRGRVEGVHIVDPANRVNGQKWRFSFDFARFALGPNGEELPERRWMPRVRHVLRTLGMVLEEFGNKKWFPVFISKGEEDHLRIVVWRNGPNRPVDVVDVHGWRVEVIELDHGRQYPRGFDPALAPISNLRGFMGEEVAAA